MAERDTTHLVGEIDEIRERLAERIDLLADRVKPASIRRRAVQRVKSTFVDETGSPRLETIVPVVAAIAGTVAAAIVLRRILD